MTHPIAALIAGVPRYDASAVMWTLEGVEPKPTPKGNWVSYDDVLAALEAAPLPDVVAGLYLHPGYNKPYPISTVLRDLAAQEGCDGEPYDAMVFAAERLDATLAHIAAQEARIKGLEDAHERTATDLNSYIRLASEQLDGRRAAEIALDAMTKERDDAVVKRAAWELQAKTQETALAAKKAKTAKLVEAGKDMIAVAEQDGWDKAMTGRQIIIKALRAALSEAEARDE